MKILHLLSGNGGADACTSLLSSGQTVGHFAGLSTQGIEWAPDTGGGGLSFASGLCTHCSLGALIPSIGAGPVAFSVPQ